jgi:hypothetical protein
MRSWRIQTIDRLARWKMGEEHTYRNYIRDLVYGLRELGSKAAHETHPGGSAFDEGRVLAYREILARMQNQADVFGLDKDALCLSGFDPLTGHHWIHRPPSP